MVLVVLVVVLLVVLLMVVLVGVDAAAAVAGGVKVERGEDGAGGVEKAALHAAARPSP